MREKVGKKFLIKINNLVFKVIEFDSYRLDGGIEMGLRYIVYGCLFILFKV